MNKKRILIIIIGFLSIFLIFNSNDKISTNIVPINNTNDIDNDDIDDSNQLTIHIKGAIVSPGVYNVSKGAYLQQVIDKAGGFSDANIDCLNLASLVLPYSEIFIPSSKTPCSTLNIPDLH